MSSSIELAAEIAQHARAFERVDAVAKVNELTAVLALGTDPLPEAKARIALQALLDVRWFDLAATIGTALIRSGITTTSFLRRQAQALIESGRLADAEQVLDGALARPNDPDRPELLGLKGRVDKQRYFDRVRAEGTASTDLLERAIESYRAGYDLDRERNSYHGANLLACLTYAERHHLDVGVAEDTKELAQEVLDNLEAKQPWAVWDYTSHAEASLTLSDLASAIQSLRTYAEHPDINPFACASTLRQLEHVWELSSRTDAPSDLLILLRSRMSQMERGSVNLGIEASDRSRNENGLKRLEAVFGKSQFTSLDWFRTALDRCGCVAKIGSETTPGIGTGWVVRGGDLAPSLGDELVLVTNAHVVSETIAKAVTPDDAVVRFQASGTIDRDAALRVQPKIAFYSEPNALDVAVLRFETPLPTKTGLRLAKAIPVVDDTSRVLIIGHPEGGDLSLSINDNALLDRSDTYLHYRAPTEGGSSGSPVFNLEWKVIGLHHAGGDAIPRLNGKPGTYQANEGIRMDVITAAVRQELG